MISAILALSNHGSRSFTGAGLGAGLGVGLGADELAGSRTGSKYPQSKLPRLRFMSDSSQLPRRQRIAAYAVIVRDGDILLARIAPSISEAEQWTLPGGGYRLR